MAIRYNADGSITVGIIPEVNDKKVKPAVEEKAEKPKKSTKKSK